MAGRKENSGKSKAAKELPTLDRIIAGDSIEELAKLPDESVDLIFADYHLVRDDGISVIGKLRKRARRHIPAVLITADRTPAVADLALAHDIHVLRKPVKPAALRAAIAHVIIRAEAAE